MIKKVNSFWKKRLSVVLFTLFVPQVVLAAGLPPHTVNTTPLGDGKARIEVISKNPKLNHDDCLKIINHYAKSAGQGGQVNVQKPHKGIYLPLCVDNRDGKGVTFNDYLFR